ncbi:AlbA family DNA-binding domain-containing protein [Amycolatopsis sp. NPDC005003]
MAVVVEPTLTEEKIRELLAEKSEQPSLDFKRSSNLDQRSELVELVKDIAAMQSQEHGGYIVIGADDYGNVVADVTERDVTLFDEANLRGKVRKFIPEPFTIQSAHHVIDGHRVIGVYVGPNPHGWAVFSNVGDYVDPGSGKTTVCFRPGDVLVRRGSASTRWETSDQVRLIEQLIARRKDTWAVEITAQLANIAAEAEKTRHLQDLPIEAFTWKMDEKGFEDLVAELIRRNDDMPIRRIFGRAKVDAAALIGADQDELRRLLDRISVIGAIGLYYKRSVWLEEAVSSLIEIYGLGFDDAGYGPKGIDDVWLWLDVVCRAYALGGLAVRLRCWSDVLLIATRKSDKDTSNHYGSWLRQALVMASRAHIFQTAEQSGLLGRAHNVVRSVEALHPDMTADDNRVLSSLCQFDVYAALANINKRGKISTGDFYTNFARYFSARSMPAFAAVIESPEVRQIIFDGSDRFLADAIAEINRLAGSESFAFNGYDGITDERVARFVQENRSQDS